MTAKRFIDGGKECIEDQFLIDTSDDKYYWVSDGLDDIVKLLNALHEENIRLKAYLVRYVSGVDSDDLDKICNDEILSEWWEDLE